MGTNTTVLIVVTALAALMLAGMLAGVAYKTRAQQRHVKGEMIPDQAAENALHVRHQEALADESAVKAHAAQVEVDVRTARAYRLQRQAAVLRSEATTSRDQLNEQRDRADKLSPAQTPETPQLAG
jgi:Na+-translocating ferredoxin:NAD+ oxidoreductase RnfG subunit